MAYNDTPASATFHVEATLELISARPGEYVWEAKVEHPVVFADPGQCDSVYLEAGSVFYVPVGQLVDARRSALAQVVAYYRKVDAAVEQLDDYNDVIDGVDPNIPF